MRLFKGLTAAVLTGVATASDCSASAETSAPTWHAQASLEMLGGPRPSQASSSLWTQCARLSVSNPTDIAGTWGGHLEVIGGSVSRISQEGLAADLVLLHGRTDLPAGTSLYAIESLSIENRTLGAMATLPLVEFCVDYKDTWKAKPDVVVTPPEGEYIAIEVQPAEATDASSVGVQVKKLVKRQAGAFYKDTSSGQCRCLPVNSGGGAFDLTRTTTTTTTRSRTTTTTSTRTATTTTTERPRVRSIGDGEDADEVDNDTKCAVSSKSKFSVSGSGKPGGKAKVKCTNADGENEADQDTEIDGEGNFKVDLPELKDGVHQIEVDTEDDRNRFAVVVDTSSPDEAREPYFATVGDKTVSKSSDSRKAKGPKVIFGGIVSPRARELTVVIMYGPKGSGMPLRGKAVSKAGSGKFAWTNEEDLKEGDYEFQLVCEEAGQKSEVYIFTVEKATSGPRLRALSSGDDTDEFDADANFALSSRSKFTLTGSGKPGSKAKVKCHSYTGEDEDEQTTEIDKEGNFKLDLPELKDGIHNLELETEDGNDRFAVVVDTSASDTPRQPYFVTIGDNTVSKSSDTRKAVAPKVLFGGVASPRAKELGVVIRYGPKGSGMRSTGKAVSKAGSGKFTWANEEDLKEGDYEFQITVDDVGQKSEVYTVTIEKSG